MRLEGHIYCEGPDCEKNSHVGLDRFSEDGRLASLPMGFLRLTSWDARGRQDLAFCGFDCLMKHAASFPAEEIIPLDDGGIDADPDGGEGQER